MISQDFLKFGEFFEKCLSMFSNYKNDDFFQKKWTSEIDQGKFRRLIQKTVIDQKLCRKTFEKSNHYFELKTEFLKIPLVSNLNINKFTLLDEFVETYFNFSQKITFDQQSFSNTCEVLIQHISKEYFKKFYFFTPIYNFDTEFEKFEVDEFKIINIIPAYFDRITSLDLHDGEKEPLVDFSIKHLKYILSFSIDASISPSIDPKQIASKFLSALRLTDSGFISFGQYYGFHPLNWQGSYFPGLKESQKYSGKSYFLIKDNITFLKQIFELLKKITSDNDSTRYLTYSIRRFDYIYRDGLIEDNITDLMISLETLLNYQPYEITDKTSLRAAILLEENDANKINCKKFIQKCYGIRSEIVHGKKRKTKILENEIQLTDDQIKEKLEDYVRKAILKILLLHVKHSSQEVVLNQIDNYTLNRSDSLFD